MFRILVQLSILVAAICSVNGFLGFSRVKSLISRPPPFADYTKENEAITENYITQRVDHFNPQNNATYEMKYYKNDEFFTKGSPIFIFVGGEWPIYPGFLTVGGMYDMAKDLNGMMIINEHRYYGSSRPTPDASTENLRYLTVDQALADLAHFIIEIKKEPDLEKSPVVLVGASYAAAVVTWFRQKYPHLAVGAWASNGPLFAKLDFVEYKEVVGAAVRYIGGEKCHQYLVDAFRQAEELIAAEKYEEFRNTFGLCSSFNGADKMDVWNAFAVFSDTWSTIAQSHRYGLIQDTCSDMLTFSSQGSSELEGYGLWIKNFYGIDEECMNMSYNETVKFLQQTEWDSDATSGPGGRQWIYQTCTEFGWYQTSGSIYQPFGSNFPIDFYLQLCKDGFGFNREFIEESVANTNILYGGFNPSVENVFFTHGQTDPWRTMGVQTDLNDRAPAVVIDGSSHCQDLAPIMDDDSDEMLAAKLKVRELVRIWIQQK